MRQSNADVHDLMTNELEKIKFMISSTVCGLIGGQISYRDLDYQNEYEVKIKLIPVLLWNQFKWHSTHQDIFKCDELLSFLLSFSMLYSFISFFFALRLSLCILSSSLFFNYIINCPHYLVRNTDSQTYKYSYTKL